MAIYQGSRYSSAYLYRIPVDGDRIPTLYPRNAYPTDFNYKKYQVQVGDRLDILADLNYNNASYWWVIANANPEIFYPEDITPGQVIRIPLA